MTMPVRVAGELVIESHVPFATRMQVWSVCFIQGHASHMTGPIASNNGRL